MLVYEDSTPGQKGVHCQICKSQLKGQQERKEREEKRREEEERRKRTDWIMREKAGDF